MSRGQHSYADYIRKLEKKRRKQPKISDEVEAWRKIYRERGPVWFAENVLPCPPDVPPHPDFGRVPDFVILTEDQKEFLIDLWKRNHPQMILAAGRGAGKTFCIAIYVCWRVACFNNFTTTVMGGSSEQSYKIKEYIDDWRIQVPMIDYCIHKSYAPGPQPARVRSRWGAYARFPACSEAAARGPHVTQVMVDEVCVGESKSKGGMKAVRSARGQLTSSPNSILLYTSTAQYIFGTFFSTWRRAERLGFKRYRWSTARYHDDNLWFIPGTNKVNWDLVDTVLYKDKTPSHWISNVWWITNEDIQNYRKNTTDDEFMVEVLGGISRGSGLVFSREDLRACICNGEKFTDNGEECEECNPYTKQCPMMRKLKLNKKMISNRRMGVDFGDNSPNAITIMGQRGKIFFVLESDERTGMNVDEKVEWIKGEAKKWEIWEIVADPEARAMIDILHREEFSMPNLWAAGGSQMKSYYATKLKRLVENQAVIIPKSFVFLITSISELAYDDKGKIRKHNDHSYDSFLYASAYYDPEFALDEFWKIKERQIKIWD